MDSRFRKSEFCGEGLPGCYIRILASQKRPFQTFQLLGRERGPSSSLFSGYDDARFRRHIHITCSSCKNINQLVLFIVITTCIVAVPIPKSYNNLITSIQHLISIFSLSIDAWPAMKKNYDCSNHIILYYYYIRIYNSYTSQK